MTHEFYFGRQKKDVPAKFNLKMVVVDYIWFENKFLLLKLSVLPLIVKKVFQFLFIYLTALPKCGPYEVASFCARTCPPQSCDSLYYEYLCAETTYCNPGCNCIDNYLRNDLGVCIPIEQCYTGIYKYFNSKSHGSKQFKIDIISCSSQKILKLLLSNILFSLFYFLFDFYLPFIDNICQN